MKGSVCRHLSSHTTTSLVLASGLLLVATACGGGGSRTTGQTPGVGNGSPSAQGGGGNAGSDLVQQLQSLSKEWGTKSAKVTYQVSGDSPGASQMTLVWQPPDSWRMDIVDETGNSTIITTKDASYYCGESDKQCLKVPGTGGAPVTAPFFGLFTDPNALNQEIAASLAGVDLTTSTETIAGVDAQCFTASGSSAGTSGAGRWCFSNDGILLLVDATSTTAGTSSTYRIEATSASSHVTAADFVPPYPVLDIPAGLTTTPTG